MRTREKQKKPNIGSIIALLIAFAALDAEILAVVVAIAMLAIPVYVVYRVVKAGKNRSASRRPENFDDCPSPLRFCFHKDKGEHHVVRGREMDPWDRPDIDISKYQRRQ